MEIIFGFIIGIIIGLAGILWAYFYIKRQMIKIDRVLSFSSKELKEGRYDIDETLESKIQERLYHLYRDLELDYKEADMEREAVKKFIADLSHQIKTPVANLFLYNGLMADEELTPEERKEFLGRTEDELRKLNWLFSELTKVTRLEGGAITLVCEPLSVWDTLMEAVGKIRVQAEDRGIEITVTKTEGEESSSINSESEDKGTASQVSGSRDKTLTNVSYTAIHSRKWTVEALVNILENSVKYVRPQGYIRISIEELELYIRILIKDNGPGILKKDYPKIFQRFYRGENVKDEPGSGLGLYLAQLILNREEGYITVSSEYGRGSMFSVYLRKEG